jgi:hypothetical protein
MVVMRGVTAIGVVLAAGLPAPLAAQVQEQPVQYVVCHLIRAPVVVRSQIFKYDRAKFRAVLEHWDEFLSRSYGIPLQEIQRSSLGDKSCTVRREAERIYFDSSPGTFYSRFKEVHFPIEDLLAERNEPLPSRPALGDPPRGHIVIQDATPTQATPEQRAAALLQSQREDAARMAKAAAESARSNADIQAKIAKAVEEARKRGNKQ